MLQLYATIIWTAYEHCVVIVTSQVRIMSKLRCLSLHYGFIMTHKCSQLTLHFNQITYMNAVRLCIHVHVIKSACELFAWISLNDYINQAIYDYSGHIWPKTSRSNLQIRHCFTEHQFWRFYDQMHLLCNGVV